MEEILRTTDPVTISFVQSVLKAEGIEVAVFDANISMTEGSIGIFPRRIMVPKDRVDEALLVLKSAGVDVDDRRS